MKAPLRFAVVALLLPLATTAQNTFKATITDKSTHAPLPGVIAADKFGHGAASDDSGRVVITGLPNGANTIFFNFVGYTADSLILRLPDERIHTIVLSASGSALEEVTVVASTRTNERIENSPTKVEVLGPEEMKEENTIRPANIASILGDVSGVQIQQSSATSANANVRIQGLNGQYTQILRDGMPLYDGFSGGFGILQIPPLDLRQIELIKGSASTLYGGGAIAGLVNLISRRPTADQEGTFTINATTLKEQDVNAFLAKRYGKVGYTLFTGYLHQSAVDVNGEGFSDVPDLSNVTVHPRLFFYPSDKSTLILGYNGNFERRVGGDMQVLDGRANSVHQYYEKDITQRNTGEMIFEQSLAGLSKLTVKGSYSSFNRNVETVGENVLANQVNYYGEASIFIPQGRNSFVGGVNTTGDDFKLLPGSDSIPITSLSHNVLGAFAQYTLHIKEKTTLEAGLRGDHTANYGNYLLPRLALFVRFSEVWALRAGTGWGYKTPNPLSVQVIDYPLDSIQRLVPGTVAERSQGYNLEGNFKKEFGEGVDLFINHAFFLTDIQNPVIPKQVTEGRVFFHNAGGSVRTMGFDTYVKMDVHSYELYLGYTFTDAVRKYLPGDPFIQLTPRNRFAFVLVKEWKEMWRVGLEGSYTGSQYRDYDTKTPAYFFMALMLQRKFGEKLSVVLNCENLLDYRQTRYEQIYTGSITNPYFKPLWAPIDGRVVNLSVRYTPFKKK